MDEGRGSNLESSSLVPFLDFFFFSILSPVGGRALDRADSFFFFEHRNCCK